MEQHDSEQNISRAQREIGAAIRKQARGRWDKVQLARRNEGRQHVFRFRSGPDGGERYLSIRHAAMASGDDASARVLAQLDRAGWLDRLEDGPETSFRLASNGRLEPWPKA